MQYMYTHDMQLYIYINKMQGKFKLCIYMTLIGDQLKFTTND